MIHPEQVTEQKKRAIDAALGALMPHAKKVWARHISARHYERHREAILIVHRERYAANRERIRKRHREHYANNAERYREAHRKYYEENKVSHKARAAKRRAMVAVAGGNHSDDDIGQLFALQRGRCACCRARLGNSYHVDHKIPLKRGGTNDRLNLQLLCPPCNLQKGAADPIEFMRRKGFLL